MHVLQNVPCQNGIHVFSNKPYSKSSTKLHTESDRSALSTFVATEIKCSNNNESEGNGGREGEGKERGGFTGPMSNSLLHAWDNGIIYGKDQGPSETFQSMS